MDFFIIILSTTQKIYNIKSLINIQSLVKINGKRARKDLI